MDFINKTDLYLELREKYPNFSFESYEITDFDTHISLDYKFAIEGLTEFRPHWEISKLKDVSFDINDRKFLELVFSLGMVELVSYWKLTCSPNVFIKCAFITDNQKDWWKKLYQKGLGEFFYTNGINIDEDFISINSTVFEDKKNISSNITFENSDKPKVLIPIGGGKDSVVTIELLKNYSDRYCYIINPRKATLDTINSSGIDKDKLLTAKRTIDKNLIEYNAKGFLNGHTPFSAIVAFSSVITGFVNNIKYVALSNESSANESTVIGTDVNHQYSKSFEFETDFIEYEKQYINSGVDYFSLLRPLTEIGIAKIFSKFDKYHDIFRSCNVGSKTDIWCANCAKCLFVYIIISPFLSRDKMIDIFGRDMLDDFNLLTIFEELIGVAKEKPFECVGSCDEVNASIVEIISQYNDRNIKLPKLLEHYKTYELPIGSNINDLCLEYDENNRVPKQFIDAIKSNLR